MEFKYESNRIFSLDSNGNLVAEITFPNIDNNKVNLNHTFVDDSLRGQGIASKLVEAAYQEIKKQDKKVIVTCSYAIKWFDNHPEYRDVLA